MAFKFVLLATLVAAASAGLLPAAHHGAISLDHHDHYDHHAPANYEFSYSVHDGHTGDIKSQHETRHGDEVHGQYSLLDSVGHHRIVDYHADHHSGFNAVVRREPSGVKIAQPVYAHAPVAHASIQHHHAAPISHHVAPIAYQAAPIAHHTAPIAHSSSSIVHGASHLSFVVDT
uniref:Uncharacterized protein n=1 Tax=Anopheles atroparvus TaxID=41427 RepID=A0AAG5DQB4_ANOAO